MPVLSTAAALALLSGESPAALVTVNEANTTHLWTFPAGTNLLSGATANTPSAPASPIHGTDTASSSWSVLTNGIVGAAANKLESVTPDNGASVTFPLDVATNPGGYTLTQFDAFGGWPDSGRDNLDFTVYYSTVSAPGNFIQLAVVANHTSTEIATHTRLTDSTGILATGVHSLKFVFGSPTGQENGYAGYREFIALGMPTSASAEPLTWTGASSGNWISGADGNWNKTLGGAAANYDPSALLVFDNSASTRSITVSPSTISGNSMSLVHGSGTNYAFSGKSLTMPGGIVSSGAGGTTFSDSVSAPISLAGSGSLTFTAPVTSSSMLVTGPGSLTLGTANPALTGTLATGSGTLTLANNAATGSATLAMTGGTANFTTAAPALTGLSGGGGIVVLGNAASPVAPRLSVGSSGSTTFGGAITQATGDTGRLRKIGNGTLELTGTTTLGGVTSIAAGNLKLSNPGASAMNGNVQLGEGTTDVWLTMGANNQFGPGSVLNFADGGANAKLQLRGTSQTVAGLDTASGATLSIVQNDENTSPGYTTAPGVASLTVNVPAGTERVFQGLIRDQNGGALTLIKEGAGRQELRSVSAAGYGHSGGTKVNAGELKLNMSRDWNSAVTLAAGSTLLLDGGFNHFGSVFGTGRVVKEGTGNVVLINTGAAASANSYSGGTTINAGTLTFYANPASVGEGTGPGQNCTAGAMTPANVITVRSGATMAFGNAAALGNSGVLPQYAPTIRVESGGKLSGGSGTNLAFLANVYLDGASVQVTDGSTAGDFNTNLTFAGTVVVGGTSATPSTISTTGSGANATVSLGSYGLQLTNFQVADVTGSSAPDLVISSVLRNIKDAASALIKSGPGTLLLQGANTYTGVTTVQEGVLALSGNSIPDGNTLSLDGGRISLGAGVNETVDSLYYGPVQQVAGTYGSSSSAAVYKDDSRFSGTGVLTVRSGSAPLSMEPGAFSYSPTAILRWSPAADPGAAYNVSQVPLAARFAPPAASGALKTALNVNSNARPGEGKLEALIAFSSGASQGVRSTRFYAPTVWQYMDILGYWGGAGASLTIPPGHVVDAAHRNGVSVLGNVFLAPVVYGGNIARVNEFLIRRGDGSFPVADKMIESARYFKFDGWFINMETQGGNSATATAMQDFLKYYKAQAPELHLSWYDSMVSDGGISWQRRLNGANQMFFQSGGTRVSDSMFLDFYWGGSNAISSSASLAQSLGRSPYDVYAGIDTEGAGDSGGNTWGGSIDWEQLFPTGQAHRGSLGIYRPEWTFNYSGNPTDAINRETRYWSGQNSDPSNTSIPSGSGNPNWPGIAKFIPAKSPLTTLPFVTNFSLGQGNRYAMDGVVKRTGDWTNLSLQDILPTWKWIVTSSGTKLAPSFDYDTAYYGGTSLKASGALTAGQPNEIKLYQASLPVTADTRIRFTYRPSAASAAQVQIGYAFEDSPATIRYTTAGASSSANWTTVSSSLSAFAGKKIALLTLRVSTSSTIANYQVNLGRLEVSDGDSAAPAAPSALTLEGHGRNPDEAFASQLKLSWTPSSDPVLMYNVYYRPDLTPASDSQRVWLGATPNHYFYAPDVRRLGIENSGYIQVEAVGPGYAVSAPLSTVQPTFEFEPFPDLTHPLITSYPLPAPLAVISSTAKADNVNAFDNSILTTVEPGSYSGEWIGLDLGAGNAKPITAIRFVPRATLAFRMINGYFQGSNTADFSSGAVELARVNVQPPDNVETTLLVSNPAAFRYIRYVSPDFGFCNLAELKLYTGGTPATETPPVNFQGTASGSLASLSWSAPYVGVPYSYNVKRSATSGGPWQTIATNVPGTSWQDSSVATGQTYYYVVSSNNPGGESANSAQLVINPPSALKLSGTVIGGGTVYAGDTGYARAFDGSLATYFEASASSPTPGWTGLDLGPGGKTILGLRYCPRGTNPGDTTHTDLLLGGRFQVSNTADFSSGVITLITLNSRAAYNTLTSVAVSPSNTPYRYVRYLSSSIRTADIAEVEFYTAGSLPAAPQQVSAAAYGTTASVGWASVSGATSYKVGRSTTSGGPYQTVSEGSNAVDFTDSGLTAGDTYYYVVAAVNPMGEGALSAEVSAVDAYAQWLRSLGIAPGASGSGFDQDASGDGIPNGVAYMVPGGVLPAATGVSAIVRQDPAVTTRLWTSTDLTTWNQITLRYAADQTGVPSGFLKVESGPAPAGQPKTFYRFDFER